MASFDLGIAGAGLATGISYSLAVLLGLLYFTQWSKVLHLCAFSWDMPALLKAMSNGSSEMVNQLSVGITTYLFNIITLAYAGEDGVAAISIILYAEFLLTSLLTGFSEGVAPIFSYHYGAGHRQEITRLLRCSLTIIGVFALISFAVSRLGGAWLIGIFVPDDPTLFSLTLEGFSLFSFSFLICGFNIFGSAFFTALSDGVTSAFLSFIRNLAGISIYLLILPRLFGLTGAWLAVPAADATAICFTIFFLVNAFPKSKRQEHKKGPAFREEY